MNIEDEFNKVIEAIDHYKTMSERELHIARISFFMGVSACHTMDVSEIETENTSFNLSEFYLEVVSIQSGSIE